MDAFEGISILVGSVAVLAAVVAVIYSAWQATIARNAVEQSRRFHHDQMHPYVYVDIRGASHTRQLLALFIFNGGPTVAKNVKVAFTPDLKVDPQKRGGDISVWEFTSLPPGASFERTLGFGPRFLEANEKSNIEVSVEFTGYLGEAQSLGYTIDLSAIAPTNSAGKTLSELGDSVEKISKTLEAIRNNGLRS